MSHCGRLKPDDLRPESFLTPAKRCRSIIAVMESIHEAGVRYCDIRVDNLMLAEAGDPAIVDFDRARFNPIAVKEWGMDILKGALRGKTRDFSMRSPGPYKGSQKYNCRINSSRP
ncbi:hypothetical protein B0H14DRAFT_3525771 [Mycena olivaceomarginata]|nr:hypothetical protein B0H14DRAFT_3525771 [Mycena olivaceomarginata]